MFFFKITQSNFNPFVKVFVCICNHNCHIEIPKIYLTILRDQDPVKLDNKQNIHKTKKIPQILTAVLAIN